MDVRQPTGIALPLLRLGEHASYFAQQYNWVGAVIEGMGTTNVYVICTEGVGYDITSWSQEEIFNEFGLTFEQIKAQINNGDFGFRDLETFIRQFGARLESNFWQWNSKLRSLSTTKAPQV